MSNNRKILIRLDSDQHKCSCDNSVLALSEPLCYEVWEYDNYMDEHLFHRVYMSKSSAYREVRRMEKWNIENNGDRWNYWWILELTISDHNETMMSIGEKLSINTPTDVENYLKKNNKHIKQKGATQCQTSENSTNG